MIDNLNKAPNFKNESIDLHFELKHFLETELSFDTRQNDEQDEVKYMENSPERRK